MPRARCWLLLCGIALTPCLVDAQVVIEQLDIEQPRGFGYQIGDKFTRTVALRLRQPYRLELDSLPRPGRLTDWLALEPVQLEQHPQGSATQYLIRFVYQLVNIDPDIQDIALPHHDLDYSDDHERLTMLIPASRLRVTAVSDFVHDDLRPDQAPAPLAARYLLAVAAAIVLLGALLGLAYLRWGLPSGGRARPFGELRRYLRRYRNREWDDESYTDALKRVHRAFNQTAGRTVFGENLDEFLARHRRYASLETMITAFFAHSGEHFFAPGDGQRRFEYSPVELADFVQACCDIERGLG